MWGLILDLLFSTSGWVERKRREQEAARQAKIEESEKALREEFKAAEKRKQPK